MGLEIEIHFKGMRDVAIHNSPGFTIATLVRVVSGFGEESYMVSFTDNDDCYCWFDLQFLTCLCMSK